MSESVEFLIEVVDRVPEGYRLRVAFPDPDSPSGVGENRVVAALDPGDAELRAQLAMLPNVVLASAARARLAVSPMEQTVRSIGDRLFRAVTGRETLGDLARVRRRAHAAGADVRISLRIPHAELAALPWEFLFDADADKREFLGRACMVTRSAGDLAAVPPLAVAGPLRVLAMVALPGDQGELDVERERRFLTEALAPMTGTRRLELRWVPATKQALLAATQQERWHIFHYIGHGDYDAASGGGRLAFADPSGTGTDFVTARQLATILGAHPTLRLAVLNACQSAAGGAEDGPAGIAAALVSAGLAAVVAMQFPITDEAAAVFSGAFYETLAAGRPVDHCVRAGRVGITLANDASLEWGTPVLHLRSAGGVLFAAGAASGDVAGDRDATSAAASADHAHASGTKAAADAGPATGAATDAGRATSAATDAEHATSAATDAEHATSAATDAGRTTGAATKSDPEPWRPEPEPAADRGASPLGTDRAALLARIGMNLFEATDKVLTKQFSEALVADLERIVDTYSRLHGPEHKDTVRARNVLDNARAGLKTPLRADKPRPAPAVAPEELVEDPDTDDPIRSKTTRTAGGTSKSQRANQQPTSSRSVFAQAVTDIPTPAEIMCLGFSSDPTPRLGIGLVNGDAHIVSPGAGPKLVLAHKEKQGMRAHPLPVLQIRFGSGKTITCLTGTTEHPDRIHSWDAWSGEAVAPMAVGAVFAYHPDRPHFVSGASGADLSLRKLPDWNTGLVFYRGFHILGDIAVSEDGRLVAGLGDNEARVWEASTGRQLDAVFTPEARNELGIQFSADGSELFVSHTAEGLMSFRIGTGELVRRIPEFLAHRQPMWTLHPGGLAIGMPHAEREAAVAFWHVSQPEVTLGTLPDRVLGAIRPAFDAGGKTLAVVLPDRRTVRVYDLR